ncbi:hypothetical protein [Nonomuraea aridisoli]|uniref:hypothetical protein n=1 Tax=Nonomuraea aridisoli TaxID=2070368 RepID=UPI0011B937AA|nr:hypothetical protein [Nonomuraea aridisoli]
MQHADRFCSWYSSDPADQIPVTPDWWGPAEETGWPHVGECRNCGERGHVWTPPPIAPEVRDNASAFARWMREAISHQAGRLGGSAFVAHRTEADVALMDWHGPTEMIMMEGANPPRRVLRCRECSSADYPCRTLRMAAAPYRFDYPGHRMEWLWAASSSAGGV